MSIVTLQCGVQRENLTSGSSKGRCLQFSRSLVLHHKYYGADLLPQSWCFPVYMGEGSWVTEDSAGKSLSFPWQMKTPTPVQMSDHPDLALREKG